MHAQCQVVPISGGMCHGVVLEASWAPFALLGHSSRPHHARPTWTPACSQAQGCVQLVHALSQPMALTRLGPVALAVLATLCAMLKGSPRARREFG